MKLYKPGNLLVLLLLLAVIAQSYAENCINNTSPAAEATVRNYNIIRFGPGTHRIQTLDIGDDSRIEIERGAVVRGTLRARGSQNIIISGDGVIDMESSAMSQGFAGISLQYCHNVTIEGISITNATLSGIEIDKSTGISISDVNISGTGAANHGIIMANAQDVRIQRCYINSGSSAVAITGNDSRYRTPSRNIVINECRFKATTDDALIIGPQTQAGAISHICFNNCVIEQSSNGPVLSIQNGDSAIIRQIHYNNITVKNAGVRLADIWIGIAPSSRDNVRGYVRDIFFNDIKVTGGNSPPSSFFGFDEQHLISSVYFNNLNILGRSVMNAEAANFVMNRFTENITFVDDDAFSVMDRQHGCAFIHSLSPTASKSRKHFTVIDSLTGKGSHYAEWNFTEANTNESNRHHSSGIQIAALLRNGEQIDTDGITLDGVDDHIEIGTVLPDAIWTLAITFRVAGMISGMQTLLSNSPGFSTATGFRLYVNDWGTDNRRIIFETGDGKSAKRAYSMPAAVPGNDWHTLKLTVDNKRGIADFYVNGKNLTAEREFIAGTAMHHHLRIGRTADGRFAFAGTIANVKLSAGPSN